MRVRLQVLANQEDTKPQVKHLELIIIKANFSLLISKCTVISLLFSYFYQKLLKSSIIVLQVKLFLNFLILSQQRLLLGESSFLSPYLGTLYQQTLLNSLFSLSLLLQVNLATRTYICLRSSLFAYSKRTSLSLCVPPVPLGSPTQRAASYLSRVSFLKFAQSRLQQVPNLLHCRPRLFLQARS